MKTTEKIEVIIKDVGLNKSKLANKLGCTRQNINYAINRGNMQEQEIRRWADALNCDVEIIFTNRETGKKY